MSRTYPVSRIDLEVISTERTADGGTVAEIAMNGIIVMVAFSIVDGRLRAYMPTLYADGQRRRGVVLPHPDFLRLLDIGRELLGDDRAARSVGEATVTRRSRWS